MEPKACNYFSRPNPIMILHRSSARRVSARKKSLHVPRTLVPRLAPLALTHVLSRRSLSSFSLVVLSRRSLSSSAPKKGRLQRKSKRHNPQGLHPTEKKSLRRVLCDAPQAKQASDPANSERTPHSKRKSVAAGKNLKSLASKNPAEAPIFHSGNFPLWNPCGHSFA